MLNFITGTYTATQNLSSGFLANQINFAGAVTLDGANTLALGGTLPTINVGRTPTSVEVYAFAPGLDASKIDVSLDRGVLRIAGARAVGQADHAAGGARNEQEEEHPQPHEDPGS